VAVLDLTGVWPGGCLPAREPRRRENAPAMSRGVSSSREAAEGWGPSARRAHFVFAIFINRSTVRQEYPHSLSYQDTTLKNRFSSLRLFCFVASES
jgi:hypothetical protein